MKTKLKIIILLFSFINSISATNGSALDVLSPEERWKTLMELVNKEIQTIKGNKYSGPELKHRLFELYSEKIKLIRQKENEIFLKQAEKGTKPKSKAEAFKNSTEQFKAAEIYGLSVIKKYPDYKKINHIYYALAMNSRDFEDSLKTESFLKSAIKYSQNDKDIMYNAKVGLAEHYYNNKRYAEASNFYQEILKNTENEWYAKHLFNAGWCYLKQREFKQALNHLILSYDASQKPKIVSMKDQILNAAGLFYIQADLTVDGIRFYEKNTPNPSFYLIQMAKYSTSKNSFSLTDEILSAALKDSKKRKDIQAQVDVHQTQLDIYRENKKIDLFHDTAESLKSIYIAQKLSSDDLFATTNKIKEFAGFMQVNLVKDKIKENIDYNKNDLKFIIAFFDILTVLDRKQTNLYHYYQAETFLSIHDFKGAFRYYQKAVLFSKKEKDNSEITKKALEAILATTEHKKLTKTSEEKVTTFAIKNYLIFYPKDEKAQTFYQKLFNIYYNKKKMKSALNTLVVYEHHFKEDIKIHREMLTQILEFRIAKKQTNKIAYWVNKIDNGYLKFETDYIQKSIRILGQLLFEKYQALEKTGNIAQALKGYESIFENEKYPKQTKAESAFAISLLKIQTNDADKSFDWLKESMNLYDQKEIAKTAPSLLQLSKGYRLLQNFDKSSAVAEIMLNKFCKEDQKEKNDAFEIIIENQLLTAKTSINTDEFFSKYKDCQITSEVQRRITLNSFHHAIFNNDLNMIVKIYNANQDQAEISRLFNQYLAFAIWENGPQLETVFKNSNLDERLTKTESKFLRIKEYLQRVEALNTDVSIDEKSEFNEDSFNTNLEEKFVSLNNYTLEANKILKETNATEAFLIKNALFQKTRNLSQSLVSMNAHPSMDENYRNGFLGQMKEFGLELHKKSLELKKEAKNVLEKNSHFTQTAKLMYQDNSLGKEQDEFTKLMHEHYAKLFLNTLDKRINMTSGN